MKKLAVMSMAVVFAASGALAIDDVTETFDYAPGALGTQNGWPGTGDVFGLGIPDLYVANADDGSISGDPSGTCDPANTEGGLGVTRQPIGTVSDGDALRLTSSHMYTSTGNPPSNHQSVIWLASGAGSLDRVISFGTNGHHIGGHRGIETGIAEWGGGGSPAWPTEPDVWYELEFTYRAIADADDTYDLKVREKGTDEWFDVFIDAVVPANRQLSRTSDNWLSMILEDSADTDPETKTFIDDIRFFLASVERLTGDANLDGVVDDADLSLLLANWQQDATGDPDGGWGRGEFDGIAPVQDSDLSLLLAGRRRSQRPAGPKRYGQIRPEETTGRLRRPLRGLPAFFNDSYEG